ncbi:hypothetical protein B0O80DRAFT_451685 [Mortierella sp. GBAus27b]|nr:hypothetical protein B0O80DRAFT_451685 [Mortierella sp. GBAus27b]
MLDKRLVVELQEGARRLQGNGCQCWLVLVLLMLLLLLLLLHSMALNGLDSVLGLGHRCQRLGWSIRCHRGSSSSGGHNGTPLLMQKQVLLLLLFCGLGHDSHRNLVRCLDTSIHLHTENLKRQCDQIAISLVFFVLEYRSSILVLITILILIPIGCS